MSKQVNLKFKEPITPKGCLCVFSVIKNIEISKTNYSRYDAHLL